MSNKASFQQYNIETNLIQPKIWTIDWSILIDDGLIPCQGNYNKNLKRIEGFHIIEMVEWLVKM